MKGRAIRYSGAELRFVERRRLMPRHELHAEFVQRFRRRDVTLSHIKNLCTRFGWTTGRERWTRKDDAALRRLYPDTSTVEVADRLGRTVASTYGRAKYLGLKKSAAYLASPAACRLRRGDNIGAAFRFQKGNVPANKGLRRPGFGPGRMKQTQFKKGQRVWNWRPLGSERLVDGYLYTKVSNRPRVPWTRNWKPTHVLRWEKKHGRIPEGWALKCLDGNRLNTKPSNWTAVPRAMLPRLSRAYDTAPPELRPTILAIARVEHAARIAKRMEAAS